MRRLLWFRRDLRLKDNPLLGFSGDVLPIFIFDSNILSRLDPDDRRVSYIFSLLEKLKRDLKSIGLDLKVLHGDPTTIISKLNKIHAFDEVVASGDYDIYAKERDTKVSHLLPFRYLQDTYIFKHDELLKENGEPYYVFTPFYKKALKALESKNLEQSVPASSKLIQDAFDMPTLRNIGFNKIALDIKPIESKLKELKNKLPDYEEQRNFLAQSATSDLSLELRFGAIGVRELLREVLKSVDSKAFVRQLIFRDFYATLLFYIPSLETQNYKYDFNGVEDEEKHLRFCEAKTGVPIIDAGVRELLKTGRMHNRVRMVVASFFTKDLLLPWQWGERFFAKHLLDYDKASNTLSWQWSAGTGVDPQPYFRVFNPYLQSKKFDRDGVYIKRHVPELQSLDAKHLHKEEYLLEHEILNYPKPMVNHKEAAKKAIELFRA